MLSIWNSQINNLQGQSTVGAKQIRPHKYITKRRKKVDDLFLARGNNRR